MIGDRVNIPQLGEHTWVELQDLMPHPKTDVRPDEAIVNAARVSHLGDSKGREKDKKLLFYLFKHKHTSPFEMVEYKFRISAPVIVWWQWVRHRTINLNMQSGRYTRYSDEDRMTIQPNAWRLQSKTNHQASEEGAFASLAAQKAALRKAGFSQDNFSQALDDYYTYAYTLYEAALSVNVSREQARVFLPAWATTYIGVVKVDMHNLLNFCRLRMADDAQYEIRLYANAIYENFVKKHNPWVAEAFDEYVLNA